MKLATRARATPPRPGFTLIEMLVAIAIIAILMALLGAALSKTTERQRENSTKQQADKLQKALDTEVNRIVTQCNNDRRDNAIPPPVFTYCENNADRALAVWTAMKLRQQFPDTFTDAGTGVCITQNNNNNALVLRLSNAVPGGETVIYLLKPLVTFTDFQVAGVTAPAQANEESGALLYTILATKSVGGGGAMTAAADDLSQGMMKTLTVTGSTKPFRTFADAWENSMGFRRWDTSDEVQQPPHVDVSANAPANKDSLDPRNLVGGWMDPVTPTVPNVKRAQLQTAGLFFFNNRNRTPAVYSMGKDKKIDNPINSGDDILGFRTRRYGN